MGFYSVDVDETVRKHTVYIQFPCTPKRPRKVYSISVLMFGYDADYTSRVHEMENEHVKAADKQVEGIQKQISKTL